MNVFWGKFLIIFLQLFFRNTNGLVLQKMKQRFFYIIYVCLWMDEKKIIDN